MSERRQVKRITTRKLALSRKSRSSGTEGGGTKTVRRLSFGRRRLVTNLAVGVVVLALMVVAAGYAVDWGEADQTCLGCHKTTASAMGAHKKVGCAACHRQAGALGAAQHGADYASMLWASYVVKREPEPKGALPDSAACLRCHREVLSESFDDKRTVRVNHRHLYERGLGCLRCHEGLGHRARPADRPRAVMEQCLRCHDGKNAASSCGSCHRSNPSDVASDWRPREPVPIGMREGCRGCHPQSVAKNCVACHGGYEMPHPPGWVEGGHIYGAFTDQADCFECHEPAIGVPVSPHGSGMAQAGFCNRCHSFPSPHGDNKAWIRLHGPASQGMPVPQPLCEGCHSGELVQKCTVCHAEDICENCHSERDRRRRAALR